MGRCGRFRCLGNSGWGRRGRCRGPRRRFFFGTDTYRAGRSSCHTRRRTRRSRCGLVSRGAGRYKSTFRPTFLWGKRSRTRYLRSRFRSMGTGSAGTRRRSGRGGTYPWRSTSKGGPEGGRTRSGSSRTRTAPKRRFQRPYTPSGSATFGGGWTCLRSRLRMRLTG